MGAPGAELRGVTFFGPKIGEDQKKDLRRKTSWLLVHMTMETKQNEKARSSPQISGVMVLHHNMVHLKWCHPKMVSPQNGVTPKWCHPGRAAPLATRWLQLESCNALI